MNSFFVDFLNNYNVTAAQCAVVLHTVSAIDAMIIGMDSNAARVYASFHELPPSQHHRFRSGIIYIFSFLATRDRHFVLNDIYAIECPTGLGITKIARQEYRTYFPHNLLAHGKNHVGYSLRSIKEGSELCGRLAVKKPENYRQGYVFYAETPSCYEMLVTAQSVEPAAVGGPMESIIQMPLSFLAMGLTYGHFTDKAFNAPGVYLLRHIPTGDTYVGSATGVNGLAGRWRDYADTIHGGNVELVALVGKGATVSDFTVTALEVTADRESALYAEQMWKRRLLPTLTRN